MKRVGKILKLQIAPPVRGISDPAKILLMIF
jgi:hypothetical protein